MSAATGRRAELSWVWPAVGASLLVLLATAALARAPLLTLVTVVPDDAYFYLKTAWHVALGHGSTFDGVNTTNGYHPLYLGLLALLSRGVPLAGEQGLHAVVWLDTALTLIWFVVMAFLARRLGWSRLEAWTLLALFMPIAAVGDFGMEVNLLLPLAWGGVAAAVSADGRPGREWLAGALLGLACLARLDSLLFAAAATLGTLAAWPEPAWRRPARALRTAGRLLAPPAIALGLAASWNLVRYGHAATVSSWLKAGQQPALSALGGAVDVSPQTLALLMAVAVSAAGAVRALVTRRPGDLRVGALGAWAVAYVVAMTILLRGGMEVWYFPLPMSVGAVVGIALAHDWLAPRWPRFHVAALAVLAAGSVLAGALALTLQTGREWFYADGMAMGQWIDGHLPADARVYQVDNAGIVAYFAGRPVINGDGLINGWDYQRELRAGRLPEYLQANRVGYVVFDEFDGQTDPALLVPLWNAPAVTLYFAHPPVEVQRFGRFVLWKIDPRDARVTPPGQSRPQPAP
ncbi:MAG: hypothetical protein R2745_00965 [Vicinamibacterales bacterium]